ncbi:hypothetical protein D3C77_726760 [compost metagenome]
MERHSLAGNLKLGLQVTPDRYQLPQISQVGQITLNCRPLLQQVEVILQQRSTASLLHFGVIINKATALFDIPTLGLEAQRCVEVINVSVLTAP